MRRGRVNEESQAGVRELFDKQKTRIAPVRESNTEAPTKRQRGFGDVNTQALFYFIPPGTYLDAYASTLGYQMNHGVNSLF